MVKAGTGVVCLWPGGTLWIGTAYRPTDVHQHHAIQISVGEPGTIRFRVGDDAEPTTYPGCIIAPDRRDAFHGDANVFAHIWVEPESVEGRRLLEILEGREIMAFPEEGGAAANELFVAWARRPGCADLSHFARQVVVSIAGRALPMPHT